MAVAVQAIDQLIDDIEKFLAQTSSRSLFDADSLADHLLDQLNLAKEVKRQLED